MFIGRVAREAAVGYILLPMKGVTNAFYLITSLVNIILHCAMINNIVVLYARAREPACLASCISVVFLQEENVN